MQSNPNTSVIISTYNQPEWLRLVLHSYSLQTASDFEIIIADDGSDERTKVVIKEFTEQSNLNVIHVWKKVCTFRRLF